MGLTRFYCIALLCLGVHAAAFAASETASSLMRHARFQQLTGNIEAACSKYFEVAALETGNAKNEALTAGAFCLAAMGEWEKASATVAPVLRDGSGNTLLRACYLEACARAWLLSDTTALHSLAENPAFREMHSAIYYTLWKLAEGKPVNASKSSSEWRTLLANEFPNTPEGRMAKNEGGSTSTAADTISLRQGAFWILLPGQEGWKKETPPVAFEIAQTNTPVVTPANVPTPAPVVAPIPAPASVPAVTEPTPVVTMAIHSPVRNLQTGFFSKEANALAQVEKLKSAGFTTATIQRIVRENVYWAVVVPAGQNMNTTIAALKKAGFESFPLPTE